MQNCLLSAKGQTTCAMAFLKVVATDLYAAALFPFNILMYL